MRESRAQALVVTISAALLLSADLSTACAVVSPPTPPTATPVPTATQLPTATRVPTPTLPYTPREQSDLVGWCKAFDEIYYANDPLTAEINEWVDSQGSEVTDADIQKAQDFSRRFEELYIRANELGRYPSVREMDDQLAEAYYLRSRAFDELRQHYLSLEESHYNAYIDNLREADRLSVTLIDLVNDTLFKYDINPSDCTPH